MEFDKEEDVLGSLYALRGGISVISAEYQRVKKIDERVCADLKKAAGQYGGISKESSNPNSFAAYLAEGDFKRALEGYRDSQYQRIIDDSEYNPERYASGWKKPDTHWYLRFVILLLAAIAVTGGILYWIFVMHKGEPIIESILDVITLIIIGIVPAAIFIASIVMLIIGICDSIHRRKQYRKSKSYARQKQKEIREQNDKILIECKRIQQNIVNLPKLYDMVDKIMAARDKAIKPIVQNSKLYYKALVAEFTPILDLRDWQHLDLVIYEIETRRADSIKEALQLVDRELQTERLERTMSEAAKSVCYTLQHGFRNLQHTIRSCCEEISDRLGAMSAQLESINNSVNIGNALQAQSNIMVAELLSNAQAVLAYD
ncbi:MAG: hypothetical protein NC033_00925 [Clostridiales bacterium]|nr:hypothetical protein [Clostridiales bacterium]